MIRLVLFCCVGSIASLAGCDSTPSSSDPEKGKVILQKGLDSWKNGDPVESLQAGSPPVTFVDFQRQKNWKLIDYEIDPKSSPSGFDVQFVVQLSLQSPEGKPTKQKAKYNVSTTPKLVVVRSDDA